MSETEEKEETSKCHYPDPLDILNNAAVFIMAYLTGKGYICNIKSTPDYTRDEFDILLSVEKPTNGSVLVPTTFLSISYISRPAEPKKLIVRTFSPAWNSQQREEEFGLPLSFSTHYPGTETAFRICRTLLEWFEGKDTTQNE